MNPNRLNTLFASKKKPLLSIYFTAGYPKLDDTKIILEELQNSGVDFVEIGMPFSDPVADGPTIQRSSEIALDNGMSLKLLFEQLKEIRSTVSMPLVLMGYINPVMQYGLEDFCKKCTEIGIDGLILPDLPMQTYLDEFEATFKKYNISNIFLITPQSSDERIKWIDKHSTSFIYMVSSYSITGSKIGFSDEQKAYFDRVNGLGLKSPRVVGFGIHDKYTFDEANKYCSGAIIGSAFVKASGQEGDLREKVNGFVKGILS